MFQSVSVSVAGPDGRPVRYAADRQVLRSAMTIGSLGGFYVIGGTRIGLLDGLLGLAVLAGLAVPAAHLVLGALVRRRLARRGPPRRERKHRCHGSTSIRCPSASGTG